MSPAGTDPAIVIIGSGFAGLCMAIRLKQAGYDDFVILEKNDDLGGTWRDNTYPGCACDVPSHMYSFSFELNPDWSRMFAPQQEIWEYLRRCARQVRHRRAHPVRAPGGGHGVGRRGPALERRHGGGRGVHRPGGRVGHRGAARALDSRDPRRRAVRPARPSTRRSGTAPAAFPASGSRSSGPERRRSSSSRRSPGRPPRCTSSSGRRPGSTRGRTSRSRPRSAPRSRAAPPVMRAFRDGIYWVLEIRARRVRRPPAADGAAAADRPSVTSRARSATRRCARRSRRTTRSAASGSCCPPTTIPALTRPNVDLVTDPITRDHRATGLVCADGSAYDADVIIYGTGFKTVEAIDRTERGRARRRQAPGRVARTAPRPITASPSPGSRTSSCCWARTRAWATTRSSS